MNLSKDVLDALFESVITQRVVCQELKKLKRINPFQLGMGREALNVGVLGACATKDIFVYGSNFSQCVATKCDLEKLFKDVFDSEYAHPIAKKFFSSGEKNIIQMAFGHALSFKDTNNRVFCFIKDEDFERGALYEILLLLSVYAVPLTIVVGFSAQTPFSRFFPHIVNGYRAIPLTYISNLQVFDPLTVYEIASDHFEKVGDRCGIIYADCSDIIIDTATDPFDCSSKFVGKEIFKAMTTEVEHRIEDILIEME